MRRHEPLRRPKGVIRFLVFGRYPVLGIYLELMERLSFRIVQGLMPGVSPELTVSGIPNQKEGLIRFLNFKSRCRRQFIHPPREITLNRSPDLADIGSILYQPQTTIDDPHGVVKP